MILWMWVIIKAKLIVTNHIINPNLALVILAMFRTPVIQKLINFFRIIFSSKQTKVRQIKLNKKKRKMKLALIFSNQVTIKFSMCHKKTTFFKPTLSNKKYSSNNSKKTSINQAKIQIQVWILDLMIFKMFQLVTKTRPYKNQHQTHSKNQNNKTPKILLR